MWKKLCPRPNAAEEITKGYSTSLNGWTTQNEGTGRRNPLTTSRKEDWRSSANSISGIQKHRKTIASYKEPANSSQLGGDPVSESTVTPWYVPRPLKVHSEGHCPDTSTSTKDNTGSSAEMTQD